MLYAIARADGGVSIMRLVEGKPESEIAKWPPADQAAVVSIIEISEEDVPADRTFRNGWTLTGGRKIAHDMTRCASIAKDRIRAERASKLAALDTAYMLADEKGDKTEKARVAAAKQKLRDATNDPRLAAAKDAAGLKAAMEAVVSEL